MIKFWDLGTAFQTLSNLILITAYSLAVLIWIWFFRMPQEDEFPPALERTTHA